MCKENIRLLPAERGELTQRYADRAMNLLTKAHAGGRFAKAEQFSDLKSARFDPLRGREDFRKLMAEVEAQAKAKGQ